MDRIAELRAALEAIERGSTADRQESSTLEFKQEGPDAKAFAALLAETAVCLANAAGGQIVIGVSNNASGSAAILGTSLSSDDVRRMVYERTTPRLAVDVRPEVRHGVVLLVATVPEGVEVYADTSGRAFRRVERQCRPMDPTEQARLREERLGLDWSAEATRYGVPDLNTYTLASVRQLLSRLPDASRRDLSRLSDQDLLRSLGLLDARGRLLRAGEVLLMDREVADPHILYMYRDSPAGEPRVTERLAAPLVTSLADAMSLVAAHRRETPITLHDGQQLPIQDFPDLAVREALANAVMHRDYRLRGPVVVEHSATAFVIVSPGPLVAGVTPSNIITHPSTPRNPALAAAMRTLGLAEETGRGVDRMFRELIRAGKHVPSITESADGVRVAFAGGAPNIRIARYIAELPEVERNDTDTLLTILALCTRRVVKAGEAALLYQKTEAEAEAVLRRLAEDDPGILEPTRSSVQMRHPTYRLRGQVLQALGSAVQYQRRGRDDIDRKLIDHVREYGRITNVTVRNLLDVDVYRAAEILADAVSRQLLVKTSEQKRGPGIAYGPGAAFPHRRRASETRSAD
jgi:ATP-dependent DNA helicase RecG